MARDNLWIVVLGILGLSASAVTIMEPSLRFTAALGTFVLIIVLILAQNYITIDKLIRLNSEFRKELTFHKDLISIKAELASLRRRK